MLKILNMKTNLFALFLTANMLHVLSPSDYKAFKSDWKLQVQFIFVHKRLTEFSQQNKGRFYFDTVKTTFWKLFTKWCISIRTSVFDH